MTCTATAGNRAKKGDEPMSQTRPVWSCVTISRTAIKRDGELMAIADSWLTATELLDELGRLHRVEAVARQALEVLRIGPSPGRAMDILEEALEPEAAPIELLGGGARFETNDAADE